MTVPSASLKAALALVVALLVLPGTASAAPRPPRVVQVKLPPSHGFGIAVSGKIDGHHSAVTLSVARVLSTTSYTVPGTITPTRIKASFGRFGSVSLRLGHYTVEQVPLSKSCRVPGSPAVSLLWKGTFHGRVRFRGEHGFATALAHRVTGAVGEPAAMAATVRPGPPIPIFCFGGPGKESAGSAANRLPILHAIASEGAVRFLAIAGEESISGSRPVISMGPTAFLAAVSEAQGRMQIFRQSLSYAPTADFTFDDALDTASVRPPSPFSGHASFQRNPDGGVEWTGSLAVSFPGLRNVPLVGPQFEVSLGHEFETAMSSSDCLGPIPRACP